MSNVLSEEKKQQVIALGKLGWSLRRIEEATGVRRETASGYLKATGVVVCLPGWGRRAPAKPAIQVTTDFYAVFSQNSEPPKSPKSSPSTCEPYREQVELGLRLGRNAMAIWQDLVSDHGFAGGHVPRRKTALVAAASCEPSQGRTAIIFLKEYMTQQPIFDAASS